MNIFIGERAIEILFEDGIDTSQDKIDDFDGRIDDSEAFDGFGRGDLKKFLVKLNYRFLLIFCAVSDLAAFADGLIELLELFGVGFGVLGVYGG